MPYLLPEFFCDRVIRERDRRNGEGTATQPLKYEGQDFLVLRQRCLAQKCLFEDHVFPAGVQSLGSHELSQKTKMKAIMWKRPKVWLVRTGLQDMALGEQEVAQFEAADPPLSKRLHSTFSLSPGNTLVFPHEAGGLVRDYYNTAQASQVVSALRRAPAAIEINSEVD